MHRLILNTKKDIDHHNGNGLDNQKKNLRPCSQSKNMANSRKQLKSITGYKGVTFLEKSNKFRCIIGYNKKRIHLGYFATSLEAAKAYNKAALKYHGEYSRPNSL